MTQSSTLAQLRLRVIRQADLQAQYGPSQAITPDELNGYINGSYSELHDLLILRYGSEFFMRKFPLNIIAGQDTYPLPSDCQKVIAVYWYVANGQAYPTRYEMLPFQERERTSLQFLVCDFPRYKPTDSNIEFIGQPNQAGSVEIRYVYQHPKLLNDNDVIESQVVSGWEEYVVVDAAIKCRDKLDLTTQNLNARKQALAGRITTVASDRDVGHAKHVQDVRSYYGRRGGPRGGLV